MDDDDRLAAVLFDMDGTLVDSEKVWSVGLTELADHYGGVLSVAARRAMVGSNMTDSMRILHDDLGLPPAKADTDASVVWLEGRVKELFRRGAKRGGIGKTIRMRRTGSSVEDEICDLGDVRRDRGQAPEAIDR